MKHQSHLQLYIIPWLSLLIGCLFGKLAGENAEIYGAWLLIASALFFGLPHGAYDFWLLTENTRHTKSNLIHTLNLLFGYLFIALLIVGVWFFFQNFAIVGFLALTVWHFGSGDAIWENADRKDWIINSFGRGFVLMFAPLTFFPKQSGVVLSKLVSRENTEIVGFLLNLAPFILVSGIILVFLNCFVIKSITSKLSSQRNLIILVETVLLILFFWLTTPLLAVTIYLIGVHSWRHLLRIGVYENDGKHFEGNSLWAMVGKFHLRALPITIFSLFGIGLIFWLWQMKISELADYTSAYLVLLSALTVPHAILITWSEFRHQKLNIAIS
jgi:beta-carotene 15,15'-dioxygenase